MYRGTWPDIAPDYNILDTVLSISGSSIVCTDPESTTMCGHCTPVLKYFDRLLILTSPTIHYDACQCNFATAFFSRIFRQNEQRSTSELDSFCSRALSCSFLGSELARFPASGRPPPLPCLLYIYTPASQSAVLQFYKVAFFALQYIINR